MKFYGLLRAASVGVGLLAAGFSGSAQTTRTQVITVKSTVANTPRTAARKRVVPQTASATSDTKTVKVLVKQVTPTAAVKKALAAPKTAVHANKVQPHFLAPPTVVNSVNFGSAEVAGTPVTMTLNYPVSSGSSGASVSPGVSSTVPNGGIAPGSASDYIFFGNSSVEFGQAGGGQPSNLTNFTVDTLNNVEYPGNGNYTTITAPGGTSAFTTGTVTENPTNYPNTTPHTQLLATFSPLHSGTFTVYILDGNTDGVFVGNSSVGIGVNGGAEISAPTHYLSGTNEFTQFTVSNASTSDVFQVYATTSTNSYPTIGGLTFTAGASGPLTPNTTASTDFAITSSSCTDTVCSATVTFTPGFPGLRYDAITLTDGSGNAAYETYVYGTGMAPQFRYELGGYTEFIDFLPSPLGVTIGPDETVYFTSTGSNVITIAPHLLQNFYSITLNGLAMPSGIAVDGSNTLYVADQQNNDIISYTAAGVQGLVATTPLSNPQQIAVDGTGALYIADTGHGRIIKIDNQGNETTLVSGLTAPQGVAVDSTGDVFYTDTPNSGEYFELPAGSNTPITMSTNINQIPNRLALDASGTVYMTTDQGLNLFRPDNQQQYGASGVDVPFGVAVDRNGDVLLTNPLKNIFSLNDGTGGNFILNTPPGTTDMGGVTVANTGNETLTFSSFVVPGPVWSLDPSTQCGPNYPIDPAQTCDVTTDFTPPLAQSYNSTIIATSNSLNNPASTDTYNLYGNGTGDASTTTVTASPNPVAAGNPVTLAIGVSDNTLQYTPTGTVTIMDGSTVLGTADLTAGSATGNAGTQFIIPSLSIGSHDISVSFPGDLNVSPSTSNHVTVNATDGPPPTSPNGNVAVSSQNFGSVVVQQNASMTFVYPTGTGNPNITTKVNTEFTISSSMCNVNCSVTVTFTPRFPGLRSDVVTVTDNAGNMLARTFVYGVGVGGLFGFDPGTDNVYQNRIQQPTGVTVAADGTVYVTDPATNQVFASNADQATPVPIANLGTPAGVAVDANQTIYVADTTNNVIVTYNLQTQVQGTLATSQLNQPTGLAVDGAGSLYVTDTGNSRVIKMDDMGVETVLASGVASLGPIALDSAGDVFYATTADPGTIVELPVGGGSPIQVANNISNIHGLALDASGKIYYTNDAGLTIIPPGGAALEGYPLAGVAPNSSLAGVALDSTASIYVTQPSTGTYLFSNRTTGNTGLTANVGSSSRASITVSNNGNADFTLAVGLNAAPAFSIDSASTCLGTVTVSEGQTCSVVVDYAPSEAGQDNGYVEIISNTMNDGSNDDIFNLFGQAYGEGSMTSSKTTLTVDPNAVQVGGTVRFLATVVSGNGGTPSGTVSFSDGSNTLSSVNLNPGTNPGTATAEFDTTSLSVGTHSITASYGGDSATQSSTSNTQTVTVTSGAPPANGGVTTASQNFGSVAVGQTVSMNVVFAAGTAFPSFNPGDNQDFTVTGFNCASTCVVSVSFTPIFPGARMDAITEVDNNTGAAVAKTFVYGTGTGPLFGFDPGSSAIDHSYQQPTGIAVGQNGVAYVSDTGTNQVIELASGAGALPILNLGTPAGVAVDGGNMVYVIDQSNNLVVTYNPQTNVQGTITTSPLLNPSFVAVDGMGSVYISDTGNSRLIKVDNQGNETTLASGLNSPQGVAVDAAGDVFYADNGSAGEIVELPAGGGPAVNVGTSLGMVTAISLDASGSVYYTGSFSGVRIITPDRTQFGFTGTLTGNLTGVALGPNGDIYTTQASSGTEEQLSRASIGFVLSTPVGVSVQQAGPQVFNTGNAPLTIGNISLMTGTAFTIDSGSICQSGVVLGPGKQCNTLVDFLPTAAQSYSDTLSFTSNSNNVSGLTNNASEFGTGTGSAMAPSTTTLAVSSNSITLDQNVTFTATVSDTIGTPPGGMVNFLDGSTVIGTSYLGYQTGGQVATAQFSTSSLAVGSHSITAMYVGDASLQPSTSAAQTVTVGPLGPPTVNSVNFGNVAVGQSVSMSFTYPQGTNPTISAVNNLDFVVSSVNCLMGCVATVTFVPQYPGTREDAVLVTDSSGNLLAKTFVYGTGTGPQFGFDSGNVIENSGIIQQPGAVTLGPDGSLYVADIATDQVYHAGSTVAAIPIANLGTPAGLAVDGSERLYVADSSNSVIVRYNLRNQTQATVTTTPLAQPNGVAVDGAGTLYIDDGGNGRIIKIDNQGTETTLANGSPSPQGIAVDSAGDVFYSDQGNGGELVELPVGGGQAVSFGSGLGTVSGIALDASGKIYVSTNAGTVVFENGQGSAYAFSGTSGAQRGIALAGNGDIFVTFPSGTYVQSVRSSARPFGVNMLGNSAVAAPANYAIDGNQSDGYIINKPFDRSSRVVSYSFFGGKAGTMTPVLFVKNADDSFTLTGFGTTRTNTPSGVQVTYPFGLVAGTDITSPTTYFGFFNTNGSNVLFADNGANDIYLIGSPGYTSNSIGATYTPDGAIYYSNTGGLSPRDYAINVATENTGSGQPTSEVYPLMAVAGMTAQQAPFAVTNTGNAPLTISSLTFSGSVFSVDASSTCAAGTVITAGSTCNTVVDFAPTAVTDYHEELTYKSNSLNVTSATNTFDQYGTGTAPPLPTTTTTLAISSNSVMLGQTVTLTATVTGTTAVPPTGMVNFLDGTTVIGTAFLGSQTSGNTAQALFMASSLGVGTHSITVMYVGDSNFQGSTSAAQTVNVSRAATTTTLTPSATNITAGQNETLTATISGFASPALTGTVNFFDGTTAIGSGQVTSTSTGGTATLSFSNAPVGSHSFTATYNADGNYLASTSQPVTVTVGPAVVTISSQNFGSVAVGQTLSMNVVFGQASGGLYFSALTGNDFSVTSGSCSTTCTATVKFAPKFPGVREDAVIVTDGNGLLLAKAYVYGIGTGPQLGFDPGMNDTYSGIIQAPTGVAIGPFSTEYFTDTATANVWAVALSGSGINELPITGLGKPVAVAVDGGGIVYVVDQTNNDIVTYNTQTGIQGTLATSGLAVPNGIAVDGAGNVYISDLNNNRIVEINNQGTQSTLVSGLTSPQAVAVDGSGNVFYADLANGSEIKEHTVTGSTVGILITQSPIEGIALDASGKLYYTDDFGLHTYSPGGAFSNYGTSLSGTIAGVAVGPEGNIYVAQPSTGKFIVSVRGTSQGYPTASAGSSTQLPFVLTNTGNAPLTLSNIAFTAGTPYALDPFSDCGIGAVVAAGQGCSEFIDFTPPAAQSYTSVMTVTSNSLNVSGVQNIFTLYGQGTAAAQSQTSITLMLSAANITAGQTETLTANISGGPTPALTGTVTFYDGLTSLGSVSVTPTSNGATAALAVSTLSIGRHSITASYSGDTNYFGTTSEASTVTVAAAPTVVNSVNFGSVAVGQSVSMNLVYTQGVNPTITATNNLDFSVSTVNCSTACTATVTFVPQHPGLRTDAVTVTDNLGNLLAKTFVYGNGTAPQFAFDPGLASLPFAAQSPTGVAVGPNGTVYVADVSTKTVMAHYTNGTSGTLPIANLGSPGGLAVDGSNTLYIADQTNNAIVSFTAAGVVGRVTTTPLSNPNFLAVDGTGALYIADTGHNRIISIDNQGAEKTFATLTTAPLGIAVDAAGVVFYADGGSGGEITRKVPGSGTSISLSALGTTINALAVDAADRLYFTALSGGSSALYLTSFPGTAVPYVISSATQAGAGIALDPSARILITEPSIGAVDLYTRSPNSLGVTATVGATKQSVVPVSNTGNTPLTISNLALTGTAFTIDGASACLNGSTISPGDVCNLTIDFTPAAAQTYQETLTVSSNSLNLSPAKDTDTLFGQGLAAPTSSTVLAVSSNAIAAGQPVTFTATVTYSVLPTGTVNFFDGTTLIGSASLGQGSGGSATAMFATSALAVGSHSITAMYAGNGVAPASVSGPQTVLVAQASTATTLGVSAASAMVGQSETLTATVVGGASPALTGSVTFFDGTTSLGSVQVTATSTGGTAALTVSTLAVGTHQITARYSGDTNYLVSISAAQTVTVGQAAATATLGISAANITVGQTETLTATVQGLATPALTGSVTFFDGTTVLGSTTLSVTGATGTAALTVSTLSVGTHQITARYSGDTNYLVSTSAAQTGTVGQATPATTLGISAANITVGQTETLTATVQGLATPALTGSVTFFDGTTMLGSTALNVTGATGTAALTVSTLAVGTHQITARYSGDTNYLVSTSAAQTVTVGQATPTTTLAISAANITVGQTETLTATVQGLTTPALTGSVTFFDGTTVLGSTALSVTGATGTAALTVSTLSVGTHQITARYSGDTNYAVSTSAAQTVAVAAVASTTTLAVSAANISVGQTETLTATVQGLTTPLLTGSVTFFDGTATLGSTALTVAGATGTAALTVSTLAAGTHQITARYSGDANYAISTSAAQTVTVALVAQMITFTAIPNHIFGDAPFTLSATASSGLAVSFAVTSGPATIAGNTVTLTGVGTVVIQATQAGNTTYAAATPVSQSFTVTAGAPTLVSISPATVVIGSAATTITLTGTNFSTGDAVQLNGAAINSTFVNATTLTAVIPASFLAAAGTGQITVFDTVGKTTTAALSFTVTNSPAIVFTGPPTSTPDQQPALTFQLTNPYPVTISGTLTLTFTPSGTGSVDDPNVQFATGGRTINFTIPALSTTTPAVMLQTGTVAGVVTVTLAVTANGVNVTPANVTPVMITIPAVVPAITTAAVVRSGTTLSVVVQGYSNTRELTTAIFHFTPADGSSISTPDITAPVTTVFANWFASAASAQYGSAFTYTQDFTLNNDASTIKSVTVTLVNSVGDSVQVNTQ
jgi:sugar lactone lactonase YvrE